MKYYEINETLARRAKHMNSFYDYIEGSATTEYRRQCDEAYAIAEAHKKQVDEVHHNRIDSLLDSYCRKLAECLNNGFEIETRCPSVMVAGPANFPVKAKELQNIARDKHMEQYNEIQNLLYKIQGVGTAGISSDDDNAIDKLKSKLAAAEETHANWKNQNKHYKKHGTMVGYPNMTDDEAKRIDNKIKTGYSWEQCPSPKWCLSNSSAEIRRLKGRIAELEKKQNEPTPEGWQFEGGSVSVNRDINRLQIFFDEKPSESMRHELKSNGFRWAPSHGCWQRQWNLNAIYAARRIPFLKPLSVDDAIPIDDDSISDDSDVSKEIAIALNIISDDIN